MVYATVEDLEARWRSLSEDESATAEVLLEDASVVVDSLKVNPDPARAKIIVCRMVKRAMLGPEQAAGAASVQQTAGPFSQSMSFQNPNGDLYLTKADRKFLGITGTAFAVDMTTGALVVDDVP